MTDSGSITGIAASVLIVCILFFSIFNPLFSYNTDFPVFYQAASLILDPSATAASVYDIEALKKYAVPEKFTGKSAFLYSMPVAYALSPLALMPYYAAKTVMIFMSFLAYLVAVMLILRMTAASGRWFVYPLALSCLWFPFIQDLRFGQVNSILLLFVSLAVYFARKEQFALSGIVLAIAALVKLFPVGIALVMGLKNRRILLVFALTFALSFLIPGSLNWFPAIGNIHKIGLMPAYLFLRQFGIEWYVLYVISVAGITAFIAYRINDTNYLVLATLSIPAVFLVMPLVEYYHLTLMAFPCLFLLTSKDNAISKTIALLSIVLIYLGIFMGNDVIFLGLLLPWAFIASMIHRLHYNLHAPNG